MGIHHNITLDRNTSLHYIGLEYITTLHCIEIHHYITLDRKTSLHYRLVGDKVWGEHDRPELSRILRDANTLSPSQSLCLCHSHLQMQNTSEQNTPEYLVAEYSAILILAFSLYQSLCHSWLRPHLQQNIPESFSAEYSRIPSSLCHSCSRPHLQSRILKSRILQNTSAQNTPEASPAFPITVRRRSPYPTKCKVSFCCIFGTDF